MYHNLESVQRLEGNAPEPATLEKKSVPTPTGGVETKSSTVINCAGDYWANKTKQDVRTQKSISMSGAVNSAIAFFAMNGERIPGNEPISQETVIGVADFFYEKIRAKMKKEE